MDKLLYQLLKKLKFDDSEIKLLNSTASVLDKISVSHAIKNISAVIDAGYPEDDMTYLISQNPAFLCRNTKELVFDLIQLKQSYDDIEEALKTNPFLI